MGTNIVVKSQIKNFAKLDGKKMNISNEFCEALNKKVEKTIEEACIRAIANNRTTLMGRDI